MGDEASGERTLNKNDNKGMWSPRIRRIYIIEFIIFGLPAVVVIGVFVVVTGALTVGSLFDDAWFALAPRGPKNIASLIGTLLAIGFLFLIVSALFIFIRLSFYYVRGKRTALVIAQQRYMLGVACASIPLIVLLYGTFVASVSYMFHDLLIFFLVGLGILIPTCHLGFALHAAGRSRNS